MSKHFQIGNHQINRLGFGAMRITGKGVWGEHPNRAQCLATLKRIPELGINFIDTADSYGPDVSENLIREALYPYDGLLIATKGGLARHGDNLWAPLGRPEYLRQCVLMSLRRLGVERIDLWQLHRIDPKVPRQEQLDAVAEFQKEGLIHHIGLSEVSVEDIKAAQATFEVSTVQNQYNMALRKYEDVLDYCTAQGIAFIPWYPLAKAQLPVEDTVLGEIAKRYEATPFQIALAWLLKRSPNMIPIPGTSQVHHLEENTKALDVELDLSDFESLSKF
ncbi:Predicted oxidoreductase [Methylobacillus rhizosphaerae]|uniref:Predicted oxidoreductase n=1 Tax=Methylobacillus rhizosphaerae TaxID=551994 RepID=A0A239B0U4_9PROT|nr:aldo/keto reductase [Methylobacillus rhizosphaerae]SNS01586.1 Predicted oxidoreductase [Methylobacillus rhizosphaerae]